MAEQVKQWEKDLLVVATAAMETCDSFAPIVVAAPIAMGKATQAILRNQADAIANESDCAFGERFIRTNRKTNLGQRTVPVRATWPTPRKSKKPQ